MRRLLSLLVVCAMAWTGRAADQPLPLESFFSLPTIRNPALSPDGSKIAYLFPKDGKLALGLFERKTGEARIILEGAKENVEFFFWKGNERLVFGGDVGGNEVLFIGVTDLSGKKVQRVFESARLRRISGNFGGIVDPLASANEEMVVAGYFVDASTRMVDANVLVSPPFRILRFNARTRGKTTVFQTEEPYTDFTIDPEGRLRFASMRARAHIVWFKRDARDGADLREVARFPIHGYAETWEPLGFAADGATLYLVSREEHDRGALYAFNTAANERGPALFVPPEGEITEIVQSYDRRKLLGVRYRAERSHYHWFDRGRAELQQTLDNTFKGSTAVIVSSSQDEQTHLVRVGSDRDPGTYFILDLRNPGLVPFKRIRPDVDPAKMRPMEGIRFAARDDLEIHGYLTRPAKEGPVPLVLLVHGGPFGVRDTWGFDNEAQFLASRGYAVLQVNYRGSGGYGREFINRGRHQWGRAMQDDLTDAVRWAVAQGIADPIRVAIYGGSYGGYAALAGAMLTPDLYRCAVNYLGPSELSVVYKGFGGDAHLGSNVFNYQTAWVAPDADYAAATSPVNLVDRLRIPMLHVYGENDARVDIRHWHRLETQLRKSGKPHEIIIEKEQGHGFRHQQASLNFYRRLEQFLAAHLR
ncbi:MAG: hypothetical protein C0502_04890 [Opitutus sp.]|nr:hypothetical protein [Opitutus sp.]